MYKWMYLVIPMLITALPADARSAESDRVVLVDSFTTMDLACKDLRDKGINCTHPRTPNMLESMRMPAEGRSWAIYSHFLKALPQSADRAREGKLSYAVVVWYQDAVTEAGTPRIRAFLKTFSVDYRGQARVVNGIENDVWQTVMQTLRITDFGSKEERQYESNLLNQKNHQERLASGAEARRAQEAIDKDNSRERAQRQQEEQERKAEAEKQRTKPPCVNVTIDGLIASSPLDLEALHAPRLTASQLEDTLARHPYSCQINQFGVAYGCQGGAYVRGRKAKITDWTSSYYVIEIPLDFQNGRNDAPAIVLRSEAQCLNNGNGG